MEYKPKLYPESPRDEFDALIKIPNVSNVIGPNDSPTDPHGIIPENWILPKRPTGYQYKVVVFIVNSLHIFDIMVGIKYPNCTGRYSTTLNYITVLRDYLEQADLMDVLVSENKWKKEYLERMLKNSPQ